MWCIKSNKLNDFLMENGVYPEYERIGLSFYKVSDNLRYLLEEYAIKEAFNNKGAY